MRSLFAYSILCFVACLALLPARIDGGSGKMPNRLPILEQEIDPVSPGELEGLLNKLREERNALEADWKALAKKRQPNVGPISDEDLVRRMKDMIDRLERNPPKTRAKKEPERDDGSRDDLPMEPLKKDPREKPKVQEPNDDDKRLVSLANPRNLGQAMFQLGMYGEALDALEKVDVVGMDPEERAPILYFKGVCQTRLGHNKEAIALFEQVTRLRQDERLVDYARWQLEMLYWHRNTQHTLQDMRKRREAAEKKS